MQQMSRFGFVGDYGIGWRGYVGLGYGKFSFHGRVMDGVDRGPPVFGDGGYKFVGLPSRFGVFLAKMGRGLTSLVGTETFGKLNINASGPSTFAIGQRVQWSIVFLEVEANMSGTSDADRSYGLEFGFGF
jgi:hypothetical protein